MRGFLDMPLRTDARTHGRTDERESIGLPAKAERPKITKQTSTNCKKLVNNGQKPKFVTTSNVFFTKKGPKWPKQEFSWTQHYH